MNSIYQNGDTGSPGKFQRRDFLRAGLFGAAGLTMTCAAEPAAASAAGPAPGAAVQTFVDLDGVETLENVRQAFHSAEKHPANPVLRRVKPWENGRGTWGSVLFDDEEKTFKAWYGGHSGRKKDYRPGSSSECSVLCYATSKDGIHWDRPELGLHEMMGTRKNNVVIGDDHHNGLDHWESLLKDPLEQDPRRRYKALGWSSHDWDGPMSGIYTMTSPDGLRWTHTPAPVFHYHPRPGTGDLGPVGDSHSLLIDTLRGRYVAYLRALPHRAFSTSRDFVTWTPPRLCLKAREGETANTIYNHMGFVYGDRYLGFLTYFVRDPKDPLLTVRLLTSRDGESWHRPDTGRPLLDVGAVGEWDRFTLMLTGAPPIRVGDKLYIFFRSLANRHRPYTGTDTAEQTGGLGLATLRLDGFASLNAGYDGGRVTTRPLRCRGSRLRVNAKADYGRLLAEVLDEGGKPIPGFTRAECVPLHADRIDHAMAWKEKGSLAALNDRPVRLRFHLENVRLYSYRIA